MVYRVLIFLLLMAIWMIFSGLFDAFHLTLGVISAGLVTWMSGDMLFVDREAGVGARLRQGFRLGGYVVWMLWQILLANFHLLWLSLSPRGLEHVQPSIVHFKTGLRSDFEKFMLANSITLTPGTVSIDIEGDEITVHALTESAQAGVENEEMNRRVVRVEGQRP
jgi:multicomponent Na+:H+ antiporter subunit E